MPTLRLNIDAPVLPLDNLVCWAIYAPNLCYYKAALNLNRSLGWSLKRVENYGDFPLFRDRFDIYRTECFLLANHSDNAQSTPLVLEKKTPIDYLMIWVNAEHEHFIDTTFKNLSESGIFFDLSEISASRYKEIQYFYEDMLINSRLSDFS